MKTIGRLCLGLMLLLFPFINRAQCTEETYRTISFDTAVSGSGNGHYNLTFPRFDASYGTLVEVKIESVVTLRYYFNLENRDSNPVNNYRVRIMREDEMFGEEIANPIFNTTQNIYGPFRLGSHDYVPQAGTDYVSMGPMYVLNDYKIERTLYNTADFMGVGNVDIDYSATTYSAVLGSVNYNFNGNAQDTIQFRYTYVFCPGGIFLAADLSAFTALKKDGQVQLNWTSLNETMGRRYEIQRSSDGREFKTVSTVSSRNSQTGSVSYQHKYVPNEKDKGKVFFRLRQADSNGGFKYSVLRIIDFGSPKAGIAIYPNPSKGGANITFHRVTRSDWNVVVMDMNGKAVHTQRFNNAIQGRLQLNQVTPGTYFVKALDCNSGVTHIEKMVVL